MRKAEGKGKGNGEGEKERGSEEGGGGGGGTFKIFVEAGGPCFKIKFFCRGWRSAFQN